MTKHAWQIEAELERVIEFQTTGEPLENTAADDSERHEFSSAPSRERAPAPRPLASTRPQGGRPPRPS